MEFEEFYTTICKPYQTEVIPLLQKEGFSASVAIGFPLPEGMDLEVRVAVSEDPEARKRAEEIALPSYKGVAVRVVYKKI